MEPIDQWMAVYETQLLKAVTEHPDEYPWPLTNVPFVAKKMREAFERGSYNKDGRAIKATCKHFGIKHTYTAIEMFFKGA